MPNKKRGPADALKIVPAKRLRRDPEPSVVCEYKGWNPTACDDSQSTSHSLGAKLEHCKPVFLKPRRFWASFISQRRPVQIPGGARVLGLSQGWSLEQMMALAGQVTVSVEKAGEEVGAFGKGKRVPMPFRDFLTSLKNGEEGLYMTTQEAAIDEVTGLPEVVSPPLSRLMEGGLETPSIMGNLVPQAVNMWIGSSTQGASSGLHHDYHDNLYILLEGRKSFRLWSPAHAPNMHTHGSIARIHANGRIVYEGQGDVLADGSLKEDVDAFKAKAANPSGPRGGVTPDSDSEGPGFPEGSDDFSGSGVWEGRDDFDDCEASSPADAGSGGRKDMGGGGGAEEEEPPSFSRVDLAATPSSISEDFPGFPGLQASLSCTLNAGDVLYLPAGWFHEVTSQNSTGEGWHMAINYWFHPPDNLDATASGFAKPYLGSYWPQQWSAREDQGQK